MVGGGGTELLLVRMLELPPPLLHLVSAAVSPAPAHVAVESLMGGGMDSASWVVQLIRGNGQRRGDAWRTLAQAREGELTRTTAALFLSGPSTAITASRLCLCRFGERERAVGDNILVISGDRNIACTPVSLC